MVDALSLISVIGRFADPKGGSSVLDGYVIVHSANLCVSVQGVVFLIALAACASSFIGLRRAALEAIVCVLSMSIVHQLFWGKFSKLLAYSMIFDFGNMLSVTIVTRRIFSLCTCFVLRI